MTAVRNQGIDLPAVSAFESVAGHGVRATVDGTVVHGHRRAPGSLDGGQAAQQDSLATSRWKVWAASLSPSAMVRYGWNAPAILVVVSPAISA